MELWPSRCFCLRTAAALDPGGMQPCREDTVKCFLTLCGSRRGSDPGVLNAWLRTHGGYVGNSSNMDETVVPKINPACINWPVRGVRQSRTHSHTH
jgi:hypothetical protein